MSSTWTLASPTIPRLLQSRAIPALPFLPTQTFSEDSSPARRPLAPLMSDISPTTSSPSLYSHAPSHVGHGASSRRTQIYYESEDEVVSDDEDPRRMSMVSGPKVRKYTDIPWADDETPGPRAGKRTSPSSTSASNTLKGFSNLFITNKSKHLPSGSVMSLASDVTASTSSSDDRAHPLTPKLGPAFGTRGATPRVVGEDEPQFHRAKAPAPSLAPDRPLVTSGSPGFGLITLEAAQERERQKSNRPAKVHSRYHTEPLPTPTLPVVAPPVDDPTPRIRGKKSGLMKYFNRDRADSSTPIPSVPARPALERGNSTDSKTSSSRGGSTWSDAGSEPIWPVQTLPPPELKPLELRPVSMTFTRGLPSNYLSDKPPSPPAPSETKDAEVSGDMAVLFRDQLTNARKAWRVQLFELEAQIRELRDELEEARRVGHGVGGCDVCGCTCGGVVRRREEAGAGGVMDRARVKTAGARGIFGSGSLYERE